MPRPPTLSVIIAYKFGRAALSLIGAVTALVLVLLGFAAPLERYAEAVHHHAVSALAMRLTQWFVTAVEPTHMLVVAAALALDGSVLLVEGWALSRGQKWGVWLVVGASGLPVPFEIVALLRHPALGRVLVLLINGAIVAWLTRHVLRRPRAPATTP